MKRLIIITILLLTATVLITVKYFKNLNPPGRRTSQVINVIPNTASLIFEFNNDQSFYEIYDSSALFTSLIGRQKLDELNILRKAISGNEKIKSSFSGQNMFISIHPQANNEFEYLLTIPASASISPEDIQQLTDTTFTIKRLTIGGKPGFDIYLKQADRDFYLIEKDKNIFAGSFSRALTEQSAAYRSSKSEFKLLPDQQASNSLGNLYINYPQLTPLIEQIYKKSSSTDFLKSLRMLQAAATLSLNYKSDALMFNGYTTIKPKQASSYLSIFCNFKPVTNHLKDIFPITTAYSSSYAIDDITKFENLLADWQRKAGLDKEKTPLFRKIKAETGVQLNKEFNKYLSNEFAVVTTRFDERVAIIQLKNGSQLRPYLNNISIMTDEETGQFNYDRIPLYLLGDAFSIFRRPYFLIVDNYLILANTPREISNYKENYLNRLFLSKSDDYNEFANLLAQQYNVSFCVYFKNIAPVFKRNMEAAFYKAFQQEPSIKDYYAASYQLSASDNEFYTNFCMKFDKKDTTAVK